MKSQFRFHTIRNLKHSASQKY